MGDFENLTLRVNADVSGVKQSLAELNKLSNDFGRCMTTGFKAATLQGKSFESVLKSIALSLARSALSASFKPLQGVFQGFAQSLFGGLGSILPFAKGGVVGSSGIVPFAKGGVVSSPSFFQAGRTTGVMGEAGAEAIMPLARSADGRLGVRVNGASNSAQPISVTINTPDAGSFRRSEGQITAALTRAVQRGQRNL